MSQVRIKIADLFRAKGKQEEAKTKTEETTADETATDETTDESGEESDDEESDSEEEGNDDQADEKPADAEEVEMTASEFNKLKADAGSWRKHKAEFETLKAWKAQMDGVNGGVGKNDQSARNGKNRPTVLDQPWNQAAIETAEKFK